MAGNIDSDYERFREIVKGHVRKNLKEYIVNGELIGKDNNGIVKVPLPYIKLPKFVFDDSGDSGIGQGDGNEDDVLYPGENDGSEPGDGEGEIIRDAELTLEELADILGEQLGLQDLKPKSVDQLLEKKDRYKSIRRAGPESLRHFRRTYKAALKRQISSGEYNPSNPRVIPVREDKRYRSWKTTPEPNARALVVHMRDISGSVDDEMIEVIRRTSWWIDLWIWAKYNNRVQQEYLVHHSDAKLVKRDEFFDINGSSGGTVISSVLKASKDLFNGRLSNYPHELWNIYLFYYSDGDNIKNDNPECMYLLKNDILPYANSFCYGHLSSSATDFEQGIRELSGSYPIVHYAGIPSKIKILDALRIFLGGKK